MPNLNLTNAKVNSIMKKFGFWMDIIGRIEAVTNFFGDSQTRIQEMFEETGKLSAWKFTGAKIGINTDSEGFLYVTHTVAGPNSTVDVYKDAAKAAPDRVCTGVVAFPGTITLTEINVSGLTGSVIVAVAPSTDSDIKLQVIQSAQRRLAETFSETDEDITTTVKVAEGTDIAGRRENQATEMDSILTSMEENYLKTWLVEYLSIPPEERTSIHGYEYTLPGTGEVSIAREIGILGYLKDVFNDDTTPRTVKKNTGALGALVADPDNGGLIALTAVVVSDQALPGEIRLICTDSTVGQSRFSVTLRTESRSVMFSGDRDILADNLAAIDQNYADGPTGLAFKIIKGTAIVSGGDPDSIYSGIVNISGESEVNTTAGQVFLRVTRQAGAPIWKIEVWRATGLGAADLLGFATSDGVVGVDAVVFSGGGLNMTFNFDRTQADISMPGAGNQYPSAISTTTFDFKTPDLNDTILIPVTNDQVGRINRFLARYINMKLDSVASPAHNIDDAFAKAYPIVAESD
jgi:hypothetical protein